MNRAKPKKQSTDTDHMNQESGYLIDSEIKELAKKGKLISENFSESQLNGCCYEFRVGEIAYKYDYVEKKTKQVKSDVHIIDPFETITIITKEKVNLGKYFFLLLLSKGSLFSIGLAPVITAADPGFVGHLGITFTNLSNRPVQLTKDFGFVKGFFYKLAKKTSKPYTGQHGDATLSWPYPSQLHMEPQDYANPEASHWQSMPIILSRMSQSIKRIEFLIKILCWIFIFASIAFVYIWVINFSKSDLFERIINLIGAIVSIVGALISFIFTRTFTKG